MDLSAVDLTVPLRADEVYSTQQHRQVHAASSTNNYDNNDDAVPTEKNKTKKGSWIALGLSAESKVQNCKKLKGGIFYI